MTKSLRCLTRACLILAPALLVVLPKLVMAGEAPSAQGDDSAAAKAYIAFVEESYPYVIKKQEIVFTFMRALVKQDDYSDGQEKFSTAQKKLTENYLGSSTKYLSSRLVEEELNQSQENRYAFGWLLSGFVPPADYVIEAIRIGSRSVELRINIDEYEEKGFDGTASKQKLRGTVLMHLENGQWKIDDFGTWFEEQL
ncbi:MAG: hypothetical protein H6974_09310 [Gammaproteobacteria bacterium]|nr:hypothetical protein [Gammaproteobacteria bacterium]